MTKTSDLSVQSKGTRDYQTLFHCLFVHPRKQGMKVEHPRIFPASLAGVVSRWLFRFTNWVRRWSSDCPPLNFGIRS